MTKLEKKAIELGYEFYDVNLPSYKAREFEKKTDNNEVSIIFSVNKKGTKVLYPGVTGCLLITKQKELDIMQQAFDTMKKDLKILKEIEHEERSKKDKSSTFKL